MLDIGGLPKFLSTAIDSRASSSLSSLTKADSIIAEIARKRRTFVLPLFLLAFVLFVITLVALAFFPELVAIKISGSINLAYALALAQFVITFAVSAVYSIWAKTALDPLTAEAHSALVADGGL